MSKFLIAATLALVVSFSAQAEPAAPSGHWITSWYASPQPVWPAEFVLPSNVPAYLDKQTLRETVRLSNGGARLRLVFSNRYGKQPVPIADVRVGHGKAPLHTVTFGGQRAAMIVPGAQLISDPVELAVAPLTALVVTSYYPQRVPVASFHWGAQQTVQFAGGSWNGQSPFKAEGKFTGRLFLNAVLVDSAPAARTVVVLGDSITDGNGSTPDAQRRWPDYLAARLAPQGISVVNAGISGGRLARDGMGVNALARLEQDVFSQPGVAALIVLLGTNDIGWPGGPFARQESPSSLPELCAAYTQLITAARLRGIRVIGATVPPFEGALEGTPFAGHYSPAKDALRRKFNDWIRTGAPLDQVLDVDRLLRDPARPSRLLPRFDSGDHLHPGDLGYEAMAQAVDLARMLLR